MVRVFYTDNSLSWSPADKDGKVVLELMTDDVPEIGTKIVYAGSKYQVVDIERYFAVVQGKSARIVSIEVHLTKI